MSRLRDTLVAFNSKQAHPMVQFVKYSLCGTLATVVQLGGFYLLAYTWLPDALDGGLPETLRRNAAVYANLAAFPVSNAVAYVTNAVWVFTGGRHSRWKELLLFYLVSATSFGAGLVGGPQLIAWFGISTHAAQASFVVTSACANFVIRKFFVFRG